MEEPRRITRDEIIGRRIVEIRQAHETGSSGIELVTSFYVLDSGVVFFMPAEWSEDFFTEELPAEAQPLIAPELSQVFGQRIVEIFRALPESPWMQESPYVQLENGFVFYDVVGDFPGTWASIFFGLMNGIRRNSNLFGHIQGLRAILRVMKHMTISDQNFENVQPLLSSQSAPEPSAVDVIAIKASLRDMERGETGRPFADFASDFRNRNNIPSDASR